MNALGIVGGLALVAVVAGVTWLAISKPRGWLSISSGDFRRWGENDLAMPCKHPTRKLDIIFESGENPRESGNVAVVLMCRCAACGADCLGDFAIMSESDGRIIMENTTGDEFAILLNGELHNLEPHGRRNPAAHVIRPPRGTFRLDDDDDNIIMDIRDPDEGDRG